MSDYYQTYLETRGFSPGRRTAIHHLKDYYFHQDTEWVLKDDMADDPELSRFIDAGMSLINMSLINTDESDLDFIDCVVVFQFIYDHTNYGSRLLEAVGEDFKAYLRDPAKYNLTNDSGHVFSLEYAIGKGVEYIDYLLQSKRNAGGNYMGVVR